MDNRPTSIERTKEHLKQALETNESSEKDYHIRNALQLCAVDSESERGKLAQTD